MLITHRRHPKIGTLDITFTNGYYYVTGTKHGGIAYCSVALTKRAIADKVFEDKWLQWANTVPQVDRLAR